ncbi:MAG: CRISPR-associated endonuclease Cas2 [Pseudomonadota bacterium]
MYVVLCYDVEDNRRRGRLQRRLKRYLLPVQKSVFEGELKHGLLDQVLGLVRRTVDLEVDTVRIYVLCRGCRASTLLLGTAEPVPDDRDPLFV